MQILKINALEHEIEQLLVHWDLVGESSIRFGSSLEKLLEEVGEFLNVRELFIHILVEGILEEQA